jgi:urease accessory protein
MMRLSLWTPAVFVCASAIGVALHVRGLTLPAAELAVAGSVLIVGGLVAANARLSRSLWFSLFAAAGLVHGYAYGEAVTGAETTPIYAYLAGLAVVQTAIALAVALILRRKGNAVALAPRLAGAAIAGIGLAALSGQVLPG